MGSGVCFLTLDFTGWETEFVEKERGIAMDATQGEGTGGSVKFEVVCDERMDRHLTIVCRMRK